MTQNCNKNVSDNLPTPQELAEILKKIDNGELRAAEKINGEWHANELVKKAILQSFKTESKLIKCGDVVFFDKIPLKTVGWSEEKFRAAGFRAVPGALVRYPAYVAPSVVLMPSFVNIGANIGEGTMVDSHALVGSCAQIGKNCHISDGVTIGGVLEPLQAIPVIVEDTCFIGAKCVLTEGVVVGEGSVLAAGTILSASVKIIDRETGAISYGKIPPYSVVVPGTYSSEKVNLGCAVIVKKVTEETRQKTSINRLLRDI